MLANNRTLPRVRPILEEKLTTLPREYTIVQELLQKEEEESKSCLMKCKKKLGRYSAKEIVLHLASAGILAPSTTADTSVVLYGIKSMERDLLSFIPRTDNSLRLVEINYFLSSFMVNFPQMKESLEKTIEILRTRRLPADWSPLSKRRETIAAISTLIILTYATTAAGTSTFRYYKELERSDDTSITMGVFYGLCYMLTTGRRTWENIRRLLTTQATRSEHRKLSRALGVLFSIFTGVGSTIQGYDGITTGFKITSFTPRMICLSMGVMNGFADMSYAVEINMTALDAAINELHQNGLPLHEVIPLLAGLFFGSLVADALAMSYTDAVLAAQLPFTIPEWAATTLGYGIALGDGINTTYGMTELLNHLFRGVTSLFRCCRKKRSRVEEEKDYDKLIEQIRPKEEIEATSPRLTRSPQLLFSPRSIHQIDIESPTQVVPLEDKVKQLDDPLLTSRSSLAGRCVIL